MSYIDQNTKTDTDENRYNDSLEIITSKVYCSDDTEQSEQLDKCRISTFFYSHIRMKFTECK